MSKLRNRKLFYIAEAAASHRIKMVLLRAFIGVITVLFLSSFIALSLYDKHSSFTVTVDRQINAEEYSLILSETRDFSDEGLARIAAKEIPDITNISESDLPHDVDMIDGQHNGVNHFAYTFYVMNNGTAACTYQYTIKIVETTKEADKIIRLRLYHNGEPTTYARTKTDGSGKEDNCDEEFKTEDIVVQKRVEQFEPSAVDKYSVVMWIEGEDADTTDDKIGGSIKLTMNFTVQ